LATEASASFAAAAWSVSCPGRGRAATSIRWAAGRCRSLSRTSSGAVSISACSWLTACGGQRPARRAVERDEEEIARWVKQD